MRSPYQSVDREQQGRGPCATYRKHGHPDTGIVSIAGMALLFCLLFVAGASAAGTKTAYLGDMVTLSGYSPGSDQVYLFMTGPNLPTNGVSLNNINRRADTGGLTTADVDPDGRWVYKWYTDQLGGKIDTGTYTIWVTDRPVDRSHLAGSDYQSISVTLQPPGFIPGSMTATGDLLVRSIPDGAVLFLDRENRGVTPVSISGLPVGDHVLRLSSPGYQDQVTQVLVQEGAVTEASIPLREVNGSIYVNTTPAGAEISIDGTGAGISPVLLSGLSPGNHTLVARKAGYTITSQEVRVVGGHMVVAQLYTPEEETRPPGTPPATRAAGMAPVIIVLSLVLFMVPGFQKR